MYLHITYYIYTLQTNTLKAYRHSVESSCQPTIGRSCKNIILYMQLWAIPVINTEFSNLYHFKIEIFISQYLVLLIVQVDTKVVKKSREERREIELEGENCLSQYLYVPIPILDLLVNSHFLLAQCTEMIKSLLIHCFPIKCYNQVSPIM